MAGGPGGKKSVLQRFLNKICVVGKDGSHAKVRPTFASLPSRQDTVRRPRPRLSATPHPLRWV